MSNVKPPRDLLNNPISVGDIIVYHPERHMIGKVVAVQNGGLHTNQGQTPALVRVVFDITIGCVAGGQITPIVRAISPNQEEVIGRIIADNPPPKV